MNRILRKAGGVYKIVCVAILAFMVLIVFVNTTLRYCFNSGIASAEEILRYLFIWLTFLGVMAVYKDRRHISVTILTELLSPKMKAAAAVVASILCIPAFATLAWGSLLYLNESGSTIGQLTGLPYRIIIASILIAALACLGFALRDLKSAWAKFSSAGRGS